MREIMIPGLYGSLPLADQNRNHPPEKQLREVQTMPCQQLSTWSEITISFCRSRWALRKGRMRKHGHDVGYFDDGIR